MTMGVFDFKSIRQKLECNEQKADFEEKNPKPDPNKVVWSPEWGYGVMPLVGVDYGSGTSAGRLTGGSCESVTISVADLPTLHARADALAQHLVDCYAYASYPRFVTKI